MSDVTQVAPGVYAVPHRVVAGKMGLIVGSRRSVAVDCGSDVAKRVAQTRAELAVLLRQALMVLANLFCAMFLILIAVDE